MVIIAGKVRENTWVRGGGKWSLDQVTPLANMEPCRPFLVKMSNQVTPIWGKIEWFWGKMVMRGQKWGDSSEAMDGGGGGGGGQFQIELACSNWVILSEKKRQVKLWREGEEGVKPRWRNGAILLVRAAGASWELQVGLSPLSTIFYALCALFLTWKSATLKQLMLWRFRISVHLSW